MRTKSLLFALFTITLFALATVITLLYNTAPTSIDIITLFYAAVFCSVFGLVFYAAFGINFYRYKSLPPWQQTLAGSRYSLLVASFVVLLLLMSAYAILNWPTFIALVVAAVLTELVWRKRKVLSK